MITDDERFIKIQGILAISDIHPEDCIKINDLIIELSKENRQLKSTLEEIREYIENNFDFYYGDELYDEYKTILQIIDKGE